jgi:hypothetical protein
MKPEERVRLFLDAMKAWERRVYPKFGKATEAEMQAWASELRVIYDQHLTAKGKGPKGWGKKIHPTRGIPTNVGQQYDQDIVRVDNGPTKSSFYVVTEARPNAITGYRFKVIVDKAGVPWVDEQRWCVIAKGKMTEDWKTGLH